MKFCQYQSPTGPKTGLVVDNQIIAMQELDASLTDSMEGLMAYDDLEQRIASASTAVNPVANPELLAPIQNPDKVICIGLNYRDHAIETGSEIPTQPIVFCKFPSTVIGPGDPIILPEASQSVDYEAELVVVMGRHCHNVPVATAMDYVFGYTCGHDVSARDWQKGTPGGQWLLGKAFDTFAPLGPHIAHKSSIPNPGDLAIKMHVSGETLQDGSTRELIFSIPELIAHLSQVFTLRPGDLIFTGTPPGVGAARKPKRFLRPGDTCEVEIQGIGKLSNPCVAHDSDQANQYRQASQSH